MPRYYIINPSEVKREDYLNAIDTVKQSINNYNPEIIGYTADNKNPRIQLEPIGKRGYIELMAVKRL